MIKMSLIKQGLPSQIKTPQIENFPNVVKKKQQTKAQPNYFFIILGMFGPFIYIYVYIYQ